MQSLIPRWNFYLLQLISDRNAVFTQTPKARLPNCRFRGCYAFTGVTACVSARRPIGGFVNGHRYLDFSPYRHSSCKAFSFYLGLDFHQLDMSSCAGQATFPRYVMLLSLRRVQSEGRERSEPPKQTLSRQGLAMEYHISCVVRRFCFLVIEICIFCLTNHCIFICLLKLL